jgi:cytochrome b
MATPNKEISMNTTSASHAEAPAAEAAQRKVLVWDAPVRVFHWLMVLSFAGAWLTAESERWRQVHVTLGYTIAALVGFRLVWGLIGTRPARFSSFVRGPAAVARYVGAALRGRPEHHTGHNPAGAVAIVVLLLLALAVTATGWANYHEIGGHSMEEVHEAAANLMLGVVGLHVAGVLLGSFLHRENLVLAMISGRKAGKREEAARARWRSVAGVVLAGVLGFWALQWNATPPAEGAAGAPAAAARHRHHGDED